MDSVTAVKEIFTSGNSLVLHVTNEVKMIDLGKGDKVKITIEKVN